MSRTHELPPRLVVKDDGSHVAVCRGCGAESLVPVTHEPDSQSIFVLTRGLNGEPLDVVYGERAIYDWSAHEEHVKEHDA